MIKKDELIKKITDELDISDMPKESQDNIISKLGENILKKLTLDIFDKIPKNEHDKFEEVMKSGNLDDVYKFLNEKIPNLDEFINKSSKNTIAEFKNMAGLAGIE